MIHFFGDFDGDGRTDILLRGEAEKAYSFPFSLKSEAGDALPTLLATYSSIHDDLSDRDTEIRVEDLNHDGRADLIVSTAGSGAETIYWAGSDGNHRVDALKGITAGEFRVDETGAATYSIPIFAPAGTAGVTPQISLNYSSQGGNGLLGQGWSIGGLSAISRCRQTLSQDGDARPITWSKEDRFCLDGQRLVLVSGNYGAPGSTYKTDIDSFVLVTAIGGSVGHPSRFKVERKDGSVSLYGASADSQSGGAYALGVLTWAQSRFFDSVGNSINYVYSKVGGHYIKSIQYAYGAGGNPNAKIVFSYDSDRPDPQYRYLGGDSFENTKRLSRITIYNEGREVRHYQLGYKTTDSNNFLANNTSRLASVRECVDRQCYPPTYFTWSEDLTGFSPTGTAVQLSSQRDRAAVKYLPADINGDGIQDIVWQEPDVDNDDKIHDQYWYYMLGGENGFSAPVLFYENSGNTYTPYSWEVIDYNADGRADIAIHFSGHWNIFLSQPQTDGSWQLADTWIDTNLTDDNTQFVDINSDGLADAVSSESIRLLKYVGPATSPSAYGFGSAVSMSWPDNPALSATGEWQHRWWGIDTGAGLGDFNGDGKADVVLYAFIARRCDGISCTGDLYHYAVTAANGQWKNLKRISHFTDAYYARPETHPKSPEYFKLKTSVIDLNGDGISDVVQTDDTTAYIRLGTGGGFRSKTDDILLGRQFGDYNHDGYPDNFRHDTEAKKIQLRTWDPTIQQFRAPVAILDTDGRKEERFQFLDVTGDGVGDYLHFYDDILSVYEGESENLPSNIITKISNGFEADTNISYGTLATSGHYSRLTVGTNSSTQTFTWRGKSYTYTTTTADIAGFYSALNGSWDLPSNAQTLGRNRPVLELMAPMYVVTRVASTSPRGGSTPGEVNANAKSGVSYYYGEAKIQASGRGMLGFHKIMSIDEQTGVKTTTTYRQDFPFIGYPLETEVRSAWGKLLSSSINKWTLQGWSDTWPETAANQGSAALGALQPILHNSEEKTYNLVSNGRYQGELLKTVESWNYHDNDGNALWVIVQTREGPSEILLSSKKTQNTFGDSDWDKRFGRLSRTKVTTTRGDESTVQTSAFTYYRSGEHKGLLHTEVIEPDKPKYTLTTTYKYDDFGNMIKATQSGERVDDRYTRHVYDAAGRYIEETYNSLEFKTEEVLERNEIGAPTRIKRLNGRKTYINYDVMGREIYRSENTGFWTRTEYLRCVPVYCVGAAALKVRKTQADGSWSTTYLDGLGRVVRETTVGFDGGEIHVDTEYDALGRVKRKSEPHTGTAQYWTQPEYDILGRVVETLLPVSSTPVTMDYDGYVTVTTNLNGQIKTEYKNALGELIKVEDAIGGRVSYQYDAQGNLTTVTHHGTVTEPRNVVVKMEYDDLGRKKYMNDPDKGEWFYAYNVFGELSEQLDANGQHRTLIYDQLGRLETRFDSRADESFENITDWIYDTAPNGVGKLDYVEESNSGYRRSYTYDRLGRRSTTKTKLSGNLGTYVEKVTYDSIGRVDKVFDAAGDGTWTSDAIRNRYNTYGYLSRVVDAFKPSTRYYVVQEMDERGNVT
ncbi:MAG: SpvB/TcaC N-terminal domain-containing protein, partial [Exilibacterium sp.]